MKNTNVVDLSEGYRSTIPSYDVETSTTSFNTSRYICLTTTEISLTINVVAICVGIVIILGNCMVLYALLRYPAARFTPFNWLLCHLAIADFIIGVTVFWWYGLAEVLQIQVTNLQKVGFYGASVVAVLASLQGLMMIALDRYYLILRQRNYTRLITKKRVAAVIVIMWAAPSILQLIIPLAGWSCVEECDCRIHNVDSDAVYCFGEKCSQILPPLTKLQLFLTGVISCVMFVITISLYGVIFSGVRKQSAKLNASRSSTRSAKPKPHPSPQRPKSQNLDTPESLKEFHKSRPTGGWRNPLATVAESPNENWTKRRFSASNKAFEMPEEELPASSPIGEWRITMNRQESKISDVTTVTDLSLSSDKDKTPTSEGPQIPGAVLYNRSVSTKSNYDSNDNVLTVNNGAENVTVTLRPKSIPTNNSAANRKSVTSSIMNRLSRFTKRRRQRRTSASRRRDLRIMKSMFLILSVFILTTAPLMFFVIYTFPHNDRDLKEIFNILLQITTLNSLLNPFLYFWRIPHMQKKFFKIVHADYFRKRWRETTCWQRKHPGKPIKPPKAEVSEPSWEGSASDASMKE